MPNKESYKWISVVDPMEIKGGSLDCSLAEIYFNKRVFIDLTHQLPSSVKRFYNHIQSINH